MNARRLARRMTALAAALTMGLGLVAAAPPGAEARSRGGHWSAGVESWVTDFATGQRLSQQPITGWQRGSGPTGSTVTVDQTRRYQTMTGFGASMTDSSAYVLSNLPAAARTATMRDLFSPTKGIGLSMLRQPMGASDFAVEKAYSYDDQPTGQSDPDLSDFSIAHDRAAILPRLREAYALNPQLSFMATPWSAPGWMKSEGSMVQGTIKEEYYDAYAAYLVKFIRAYERAGIPTDYLSIGNEPLYEPDSYPGMGISAQQAATIIGRHVGPALERSGVDTQLLGYDHNWDVTDYPETIYHDRRAARYVPGTAWHCYGGSVTAQTVSHNNYPHAQAFETECSGGEWQGTPAEAFRQTMASVIGVPRNWGQSVVLWNLALDDANGPFIGGCDTCRGVVTTHADGTVTKNLDFYALGHASAYVRPGAVRIASSELGSTTAPGVSNVAFSNRDGSQVMIAYNGAATEQRFSVQVGGRHFDAVLAPGAAATYRWHAPRRLAPAKGLGWVDLDFGRGPAGTPGGRLVQSVSPEVVDALTQVKLGDRWLSYSLPYGANLERQGRATTLPRTGWKLSAQGTTPVPADPLTNMIDGRADTRWSSGTGQSDGMSLTVDLGRSQTFSEISLDPGTSAGDYLRSYAVQTSTNGTSWTDVARGAGRIERTGEMVIPLPTTTTRYLRLVSRTGSGSWWSIHELNLRSVAQTSAAPVRAGRALVRDSGRLPDGTRLVGYYNAGRTTTNAPWPVRGFGYTYRLPATAAVTYAVR